MNDNRKLKIIMVGPSPRAQGGMAAVMAAYLNSDLKRSHTIFPVFTRLEGAKLKKLLILMLAIFHYLGVCIFKAPGLSHIHFCSNVSFYRKSLFVLMAKVFGQKIIFHAHGGDFYSFYQQSSRPMQSYIRKIFQLADLVVTLSDCAKKHLEEISSGGDVRIVYNTVSDFRIVNLTQKNKPDKKYKTQNILFLGRIEKAKGIYELIEAAALVKRTYPQTKFILAGEGEIENAKKMCRLKKVENMFEFPGWVDANEKIELFRQATCFVLPSYRELQSVSVLEAMAAGLPVIGSEITGISEAIENGVNGFLVPAGDHKALAEKIVLLLKSRKLQLRMSENNVAKFKKCFDISIIIDELEKNYLQVISQR